MQTISGIAHDAAGPVAGRASTPRCNDELLSMLAHQTLTHATHRKIVKLQALVQACREGRELLAGELANVLGCSMSAVGRYISELERLQVIRVARYTKHAGAGPRLPVYGLGRSLQNVGAVMSWKPSDLLSAGVPAPKVPKKGKARPSTSVASRTRDMNKGGASTEVDGVQVHMCEDGPNHRYRPSTVTYRRDPLVAAMFGEV